MRQDRLAKLAVLKKVALSNDEKASTAEIAGNAASSASAKTPTDKPVAIINNNTSIDVLMGVGEGSSNTLAPGSMRYADIAKKVRITAVNGSASKEFPAGYFKADYTYTVSSLIDVGAYTSNASGKNQPQATRGTAKAKTPISLAAGATVSDDWGTYTGVNQYSFKFKSNNGKEGTYDSSKSGWEQSAAKINALVAEKSKSTAATPAAQTQTPAATTPTAGEAAKTQQTGRQFNPTTIANVVAILQRAAKPGGMGLAAGSWTKDERGRIQKIISTINTVNNRVDAYDLLAKILIVTSGAEASFNGALGGDNYVKQIASADRRDVVADRKGGGTFSRQVAFVLDYMNQFYDGEFADDNAGTIKKFLKDFSSGEQPAEQANTNSAPANTQQAAGQQPTVVMAPSTKDGGPKFLNEEEKKKFEQKQNEFLEQEAKKSAASRVDPRIKKLATLRRLRVRSQMEAATESSAQFGRSRVS